MYLNKALSQLVVLSDCGCPGHELRLECTVVGAGTTVWTGSAFDCPMLRDGIYLHHSRFQHGTYGTCSDGRIIGRSINTTSDSDGIKYISQLIIQLDESGALEGGTVECAHNDGLVTIVIGTINYTRGINNY